MITQSQIEHHIKLHMDWSKYLPVSDDFEYVGFTPIANRDIILSPEEYEKIENKLTLKHTTNMPWEGDFTISRDIFTDSDFTCEYDCVLEMYDHETIPTEVWRRLKDNEDRELKHIEDKK